MIETEERSVMWRFMKGGLGAGLLDCVHTSILRKAQMVCLCCRVQNRMTTVWLTMAFDQYKQTCWQNLVLNQIIHFGRRLHNRSAGLPINGKEEMFVLCELLISDLRSAS